MKRAVRVLPHVTIVMAGMMIVFFLIDRVNTPMGFMVNGFHKWLSFLLALSCLGYSVLMIIYQNRMEDKKRARARKAQARPAQAARPPQNGARPAQSAARRPEPGNRVQGK